MVKRLKLLLLAATMTLAAMAAIGTVSASATVLCDENAAPCPAEGIYPSGTEISASLEGTLKIPTSAGTTFSCTGSTLSGETQAKQGVPLPIEVTNLTLSSCSGCPFTEKMSTKTASLPYSAGLTDSSKGETLTIGEGTKGDPNLNVTCDYGIFGTVTCSYGLGGFKAGFAGGSPATLTFSGAVKVTSEEPEICGTAAELKATYSISSPKPAFAQPQTTASQPTVFCKEVASVCSSSAIYPKGTTIEAEAKKVEFGYGGSKVICDSAMTLESQAASGLPLSVYITSVGFSNCEGECETVEDWNPPFGSSFSAFTTGGDGTFLLAGFGLKFKGCGFAEETCEYEVENAYGEFEGGTSKGEPTLRIPKVQMRYEGSEPELCSQSVQIQPDYEVNSPVPLWLGVESE